MKNEIQSFLAGSIFYRETFEALRHNGNEMGKSTSTTTDADDGSTTCTFYTSLRSN